MKGEKITLILNPCELDDVGQYSCEIAKFVKPEESDSTDCFLNVQG